MAKFYTGTGDNGTTNLLGNCRVAKNHPRIEAVGAIDEANAALGVVRALTEIDDLRKTIITIQRDLYSLMSEVAATEEHAKRFQKISSVRVTWLEEQVEIIGNQVEFPREFIVPGDTVAGAFLDSARTIVRRAERLTTALGHKQGLANEHILPYLNRLSTLCFLLELWVTKKNAKSSSLAKPSNP